MPYARFISKWFANVPNINLGIMQAFLKGKGKSVKTFHFHLEFLPYLKGLPPCITENLIALTEQYGVEYMGLDYIFASLLFEDEYLRSKGRFSERLDSLGLSLNDFEQLRQVTLDNFEFPEVADRIQLFSLSTERLSAALFKNQECLS